MLYDAIAPLLPGVQKPARYTGGEVNMVKKNPEAACVRPGSQGSKNDEKNKGFQNSSADVRSAFSALLLQQREVFRFEKGK